MNRKIEHWILSAIIAVFCLYILLRAWILPITVDESSTAINHVPRLVFDTLTYQKEANPNNHILNTILIKILTGIFGWHHIVVRMPALIGGFLYAWASLHLVRKISDQSWVRIFALLMLFGNPFMLEFFSLARGYALAIGFMMLALWQSWLFLESNRRTSLRLAFIFAGLAVYSNFTLLIFFAPFIFMMLLGAWQLNPSFSSFWKQAKPSLITLGVYILLWLSPLKKLSKDSELVHWNSLGSFFESIQRSVGAAIHMKPYLGNDSDRTLTWLLFSGAIILTGIALWRWWQQGLKFKAEPRVFLVLLLLAVVLTNIAQVHLTQTPYLQSRLSLFYWPLFALSLGCGASWVSQRFGLKKAWLYMAPLLLLTFINTVRTANLRYSYEWLSDSDTFTVLDYLKKTYEAEGRTEPFVLDAVWFMQNSFVFHLEKGHYGYEKYVKMVPYHGRQDAQRNSDFYYTINLEAIKDVIDSYNVALQIPNTKMVLFRKK